MEGSKILKRVEVQPLFRLLLQVRCANQLFRYSYRIQIFLMPCIFSPLFRRTRPRLFLGILKILMRIQGEELFLQGLVFLGASWLSKSIFPFLLFHVRHSYPEGGL